jgi:1,4-dihydroxy-6-naphthoate synthase
MTIRFSISPCPNDTFIFAPLILGKIDTGDIRFEFHLDDVEALNKEALMGQSEVTKLSFNAFTRIYKEYQLLTSGAALGNNCGPLLIAKHPVSREQIHDVVIGIPGFNTTAYLLLKYAYGTHLNVREMLFSDIEQALLNDTIDAGIIIHENRFTYEKKGLHKIIDLGEHWEQATQSPIPLGGIVVRRDLPQVLKIKIDSLVTQSIRYAFENPEEHMPFIRSHAQEMEEDVMRAHIELYVNDFSVHPGGTGKKAIITLFKAAIPDFSEEATESLFVNM